MNDSRYPAWWNPTHASTWDNVKESLRRDWEQTQHDLSGGRFGQDLNQNVDDTLGQMVGSRPIPPADVANPLDGPELRQTVSRAQAQMRDLEQDYEEGATDTAEVFARDWSSSEAPLRFGYLSALRFGSAWSPEVERRLRLEWNQVSPREPWENVHEDVRYAWERAALAVHS